MTTLNGLFIKTEYPSYLTIKKNVRVRALRFKPSLVKPVLRRKKSLVIHKQTGFSSQIMRKLIMYYKNVKYQSPTKQFVYANYPR